MSWIFHRRHKTSRLKTILAWKKFFSNITQLSPISKQHVWELINHFFFKHLFRPFTICHNSRLQDFCIIAFSLFRLTERGDADEHCHPIKCWSYKAQLLGGDPGEIYFCQLLHINFPNMNLQRSKKDIPIRCVFRSFI